MRPLAATVLALLGALLLWAGSTLPGLGDPASPVQSRLTEWFMAEALDTGTHNAVTAILADVRGFDTLGETTVIFAAGLAAWLILGRPR